MSVATVESLCRLFESGEMEREAFVTALGNIQDYENGQFIEEDGYIPGTADAFVQAWMSGVITEQEASQILLRWDERGLK